MIRRIPETEDEIVLAVKRGADRLDEVKPGWHNLVIEHYGPELADMQVSHPSRCILNATFGSFSVGVRHVGVNEVRQPRGFSCPQAHNEMYREAWAAEVQARKYTN